MKDPFASKDDSREAAPSNSQDSGKPIEQNQPDQICEKLKKSWAWPLWLMLLLIFVLAAILGLLWVQQDGILALRLLWIAVCSFLPLISIAAFIGSIIQIRYRPISSFISLVLATSMLLGCFLVIKKVLENAGTWLR